MLLHAASVTTSTTSSMLPQADRVIIISLQFSFIYYVALQLSVLRPTTLKSTPLTPTLLVYPSSLALLLLLLLLLLSLLLFLLLLFVVLLPPLTCIFFTCAHRGQRRRLRRFESSTDNTSFNRHSTHPAAVAALVISGVEAADIGVICPYRLGRHLGVYLA